MRVSTTTHIDTSFLISSGKKFDRCFGTTTRVLARMTCSQLKLRALSGCSKVSNKGISVFFTACPLRKKRVDRKGG